MTSTSIAIITAIIWIGMITLVGVAIFKLFQIEKHLRPRNEQSDRLNNPDLDEG